jgi:FKBP-type peptidyl-prolyl cis-trans isomerase FkpA
MSNTTVPIAPIAKGSMTRLWTGLGILGLAAAGLAWWGTVDSVGRKCSAAAMTGKGKVETLASGVMIETLVNGKGPFPKESDVSLINYVGKLMDGTQFDAGQKTPMPLAGVIKGFSEGLLKMQKGGSYHICIPSRLAYGPASPSPKIPANSALLFDIDMLDFVDQQIFQAMQQQQQGAAAGGPPPGN